MSKGRDHSTYLYEDVFAALVEEALDHVDIADPEFSARLDAFIAVRVDEILRAALAIPLSATEVDF